MTKKYPSILNVLLALAMVVALVGVIVAPASAAPSGVTVSIWPNKAGVATETTVTFTSGGALPVGTGWIEVTFPERTVVPERITASLVSVSDGNRTYPCTSVTVSGRAVRVTVPRGPNSQDPLLTIVSTTVVSVVFNQTSGIESPWLARNPANPRGFPYVATVATSDTPGTTVQSAPYNVFEWLSASKTSGKAGDAVTVTGGGFTAESTVELIDVNLVTLEADQPLLGSADTSTTGKLTMQARVNPGAPAAPPAVFVIGADGNNYRNQAAADYSTLFTVLSSVSVTPISGVVDSLITVKGTGFTANRAFRQADGGNGTITFGGGDIPGNPPTDVLTWRSHTAAGLPGTSETGLFEVMFPVPAVRGSIGGTKTIRINDGFVVGETKFTVGAPTITTVPQTSKPNTMITVNGSGFPASAGGRDADRIYWTQTQAANATPPAEVTYPALASNAQGAFVVSNVRVPRTYPDGQAWIHADMTTKEARYANLPNLPFTTVVSVKTTFTVGGRALTFDPASGPKGIDVIVNGSDLTTGGNAFIEARSMTIGNIPWNEPPWLSLGQPRGRIAIDTSGKIVPTSIEVPTVAGLGYGDNLVQARDSANLLAEGTFTVTRPTIELSPDKGYMGTSVLVKGMGWVPSGEGAVTIRISRGEQNPPVTAVAIPDANGAFNAAFDMPVTVGVGLQTVSVLAADNLRNDALPALFEVQEPGLTVDPKEASAEDPVKISGMGFQPQTGLDRLTLGGGSVMPVTGVWTDSIGKFEVTIKVPGLAIGGQTVQAEDAMGNIGSTSLRIIPVPPTVQQALASLIAANELVIVWDYADGEWAMFDPADPVGSDLTRLVDGTGYWINVTTDAEVVFGTKTRDLPAGWSLMGW